MDREILARVVKMAGDGYVFVATADSQGTPHLAAAGELSRTESELLAATEWFCPRTVKNLKENRSVTISVWQPDSDRGYQIAGKLEHIEDVGVLDGFSPEQETDEPLPQVEKRLLIRPLSVSEFRQAPHTDSEI
jgi:hypothetical protein